MTDQEASIALVLISSFSFLLWSRPGIKADSVPNADYFPSLRKGTNVNASSPPEDDVEVEEPATCLSYAPGE